MEEKMSFPEQFIGSIFKLGTYRYFFHRSLGRALLYLFLASILLAGLGSIRFFVEFNTQIDEFIISVKNNLPDFELKNGALAVEGAMPHVVSESAGHIIVIDTSGQLDQSVLDAYETGILLTENDWYQKQNRFETRRFDLGAFAGATVTRADLLRWLPALKWLMALIALFGFIFYLIGKLLAALIVSLGGYIILSSCK